MPERVAYESVEAVGGRVLAVNGGGFMRKVKDLFINNG